MGQDGEPLTYHEEKPAHLRELGEALPLFTATSLDPSSEPKAFACLLRITLVFYKEKCSLSVNSSNVQRAAGSEERPWPQIHQSPQERINFDVLVAVGFVVAVVKS